ncbi:MAG: phage major capsid protein [Chloroflexi bacterium]|nr:phage major capsid protein [Chloroflexota bacterium]
MSIKKQLDSAQARLLEVGDEMDAVGALAETENRDLTDGDQATLNELSAEFKNLESKIPVLKNIMDAKDRISAGRISSDLVKAQSGDAQSAPKAASDMIPAQAKAIKTKCYSSNYDAYACGKWLAATILKRGDAKQWCRDNNIGGYQNAMEEGTDNLGGYSVPDPMAATIIELVESWGVYRQYSRNVAMTSDTLAIPKWAAGLTVYYPAEGDAITASDLTFDQVNLAAVKYAQLGIMSTELNEDSIISMTDLLTRDMARNFAFSEDNNAFNGDGTATFGGITGIKSALAAGSKVTGAATIGALTLADFEDAAGRLKDYAGLTPAWYMNRYTYWNSVVPLLNAAGGTDMRQLEAGGQMQFMGYPVVFTQALAGQGATTDDMVAVVGDLDLTTYLGTRRQVSIRQLNELYAANDQIGVISTLRSQSICHDPGTVSAAGGLVGVYLGA